MAVSCGGTPAAELRGAGAVEVWTDPRDLLESIGKSILGASG